MQRNGGTARLKIICAGHRYEKEFQRRRCAVVDCVNAYDSFASWTNSFNAGELAVLEQQQTTQYINPFKVFMFRPKMTRVSHRTYQLQEDSA
jgi:hypothetical protein